MNPCFVQWIYFISKSLGIFWEIPLICESALRNKSAVGTASSSGAILSNLSRRCIPVAFSLTLVTED